MRDHCSEKEITAIRIESLAILLIHAAVIAVRDRLSCAGGSWRFVALAWHIGSPIEVLWHATKHIGRPYNVNDHRLNTRSVRVSWFIKLILLGTR